MLFVATATAGSPAAAQDMIHASSATPPRVAAGKVATVEPIPFADELTFRPMVDLRVRYENVDQDGVAKQGNAVTARLRVGGEVASTGGLSALVEAQGLLPINPDYNSSTNGKTAFASVSDPRNLALYRAQLQYCGLVGWVFTAGRQAIALDDQRFVGSSPWRQNGQTFDAMRVEAQRLGPFFADVAYAWSDRTTYGITADQLPAGSTVKQAIRGNNVFAGVGIRLAFVTAKGFAFLVDQNELGRRQFSSQTYGGRAVANFTAGPLTMKLVGSYARQYDWSSNPNRYAASYWVSEGGTSAYGCSASAGYEVLGADGGASASTAFQTPVATLHKFNGNADKFLVTPANGLTDLYASLSHTFPDVRVLSGLNVSVTYHRFDSDRLELHYGDEWDAQLGLGYTASVRS